MSGFQEKQLIKTIVCPAKVSDFNPKIGENTLDYKSSIQAARGAVTKLSNNLAGYAPFCFVDNFFKDPVTKKVIGPVLVIGKEKKLQKHFINVEMKSGKLDQSSSANQKEAATGRVYAQKTEKGIVLCFEPHPKCKVPNAKWDKIFKKLKPFLKGFSCELVAPSAAAVAEAAADDAVVETTVERAINEGPDLTQLVEQILSGLKVKLPNQVIPNIKSKNLTGQEMGIVTALLKSMDSFKAAYPSAPAAIRANLQNMSVAIDKQYAAVQKVRTVLEGLQNTATPEPAMVNESATSRPLNARLQQLLKEAETAIQNAQSNQQTRQATLSENSGTPLMGGAALLNLI